MRMIRIWLLLTAIPPASYGYRKMMDIDAGDPRRIEEQYHSTATGIALLDAMFLSKDDA